MIPCADGNISLAPEAVWVMREESIPSSKPTPLRGADQRQRRAPGEIAMRRSVRLVLAVLAGFIAGSTVNMALVQLSGSVIPPPAGADVTTADGLKASLHLFEPKHFVFPFLAHALGTLVAAVLATLLAPGRSSGPAWTVGTLFLLGGIATVFMLPAPLWFTAIDLGLAYLPAAWLGHRLAIRWAPDGTPKPTPYRSEP